MIDDASHIGQLTRISFWCAFEHLKPGGLYVIEDWGCGYMPDWHYGRRYRGRPVDFTWAEKVSSWMRTLPVVERTWALRKGVSFLRKVAMPKRFPSHDYGMVGFVKELVDECAAVDWTDPEHGYEGPKRGTRFASLTFQPGMVIVRKKPSMKPSAQTIH